MNNPYRWDRVNAELFFGRQALVDELVRGTLEGRSYGLAGGRRMGKTTLLRRIELDLSRLSGPGALVIPVYIDTHSLVAPLAPETIFQGVLQVLSEHIPKDRPEPQIHALHPFARALAGRLGQAAARPQVIILFDELQPILNEPWGGAFFANWRAFLHNTPGLTEHIAAIFAGARDLDALQHDLGSPLANILNWRALRVFPRAETARLAREPSGRSFDESFIDRLHELSGGHPFLLQYLMHAVVEAAPEGAADALDAAATRFLVQDRAHFQMWWDGFDRTARRLFAALADQGGPLPTSVASQLLEPTETPRAQVMLVSAGVADMVDDAITPVGLLFRQWFEKYGRTQIEPPAIDRVDRLLYRLEHRLREQLDKGFQERFGVDWPNSAQFKSVHRDLVEKWRKTAKLGADDPLPPDRTLEYSDLADLLNIVASRNEWSHWKDIFRLGPDPNMDRTLFADRRAVLVRARNSIRHARSHELTADDLLKAEAFAQEILRCLELG